MAPSRPGQDKDDLTSYFIDISRYNTHGLCSKYLLRRHKFEAEANAGCHEARLDWINYIGPIDRFGGCNPINGNFTAVVLPLCIPERLRLVAYVLEFAFLYDDLVERENSNTPSGNSDLLGMETKNEKHTNPVLGRKQIQSKMIAHLTSTDKECAERVKNVWKEMVSTTLRDKDKQFASLEEYVDFRIIDTGAPFVEAMMLFGMGLTLTAEEDLKLKSIIRPCYAALGLANDYFSFDREYNEFTKSATATTLTNSVWLSMQWHNVDVGTAKELVKQATIQYENQFKKLCAQFKRTHAPISEKLDWYLRALAYQVSGNVVWSLNCPRYHPDFRYDANAGVEDSLTASPFAKVMGVTYDAKVAIPSNS